MIEYDWLIMDNITFTLEVCLDHVSHYLFCMYVGFNIEAEAAQRSQATQAGFNQALVADSVTDIPFISYIS